MSEEEEEEGGGSGGRTEVGGGGGGREGGDAWEEKEVVKLWTSSWKESQQAKESQKLMFSGNG